MNTIPHPKNKPNTNKTHDPSSKVNRLQSTPRCNAKITTTNVRTDNSLPCQRPCLRLNPRIEPKVYTKRCSMHGGRAEQQAYNRQLSLSLTSQAHDTLNNDINSILIDKEQKPERGEAIVSEITRDVSVMNERERPEIEKKKRQLPPAPSPIREPEKNFLLAKDNVKPMVSDRPELTVKDKAIKKSFDKLKGQPLGTTLGDCVALIGALLEYLMDEATHGELGPDEIKLVIKLTRELARLEKDRKDLEKVQSVQYSRTTLKMTTMKLIKVFKKYIQPGREEEFSAEMSDILKPSVTDPGDILITQERRIVG